MTRALSARKATRLHSSVQSEESRTRNIRGLGTGSDMSSSESGAVVTEVERAAAEPKLGRQRGLRRRRNVAEDFESGISNKAVRLIVRTVTSWLRFSFLKCPNVN